jgi:hypothetical protein
MPKPPVPTNDDVWQLPTGGTIPKVITLDPIPQRAEVATVKFRDPSDVDNGDRKIVLRQVDPESGMILASIGLTEGILALLIEEWSFTDADGNPLPLPAVAIGSLDRLKIPDMNALTAAVMPVRALLFPRDSDRKVDDPTHPTEPSNA